MGETRRVVQRDAQTGEPVEGALVFMPTRHKFSERYCAVFIDQFATLANDPTMTGQEYRVLVHLMGKLDFENYILTRQSEVSKALHISSANASRCFRGLTRRRVIEKGPMVGKIATYRFNPDFVWRGSVQNYKRAKHARLTVVSGKAPRAEVVSLSRGGVRRP